MAFLTLVLVKISFINSQVIDQEVGSDLMKLSSIGKIEPQSRRVKIACLGAGREGA